MKVLLISICIFFYILTLIEKRIPRLLYGILDSAGSVKKKQCSKLKIRIL